jgi:hypothetical protein
MVWDVVEGGGGRPGKTAGDARDCRWAASDGAVIPNWTLLL